MAISFPRMERSSGSRLQGEDIHGAAVLTVQQRAPLTISPGLVTRRMIDLDITLFPQPDSPIMPIVSRSPT